MVGLAARLDKAQDTFDTAVRFACAEHAFHDYERLTYRAGLARTAELLAGQSVALERQTRLLAMADEVNATIGATRTALVRMQKEVL